MNRLELRSERVAWEIVEDRVVALDLGSSEYFSLNATGTLLWQALVAGASEEDLVGSLTERYGIPREQASEDVRRFVETLGERDLLER